MSHLDGRFPQIWPKMATRTEQLKVKLGKTIIFSSTTQRMAVIFSDLENATNYFLQPVGVKFSTSLDDSVI